MNERTVVLENTSLRVVCLPEFGGKLVAVYDKQRQKEFLFQNPKSSFRHADVGSDFSDFEACGFDDGFPSLDAGLVLVGEALVPYPDHGEIWSASFLSHSIAQDAVTLSYTSRILPYHYQKTYSLDQDGLKIEYRIINNGQISFPCIWTLHCLLQYEEGMELIFPADTREVVNAMPGTRLGKQGDVFPFPLAGLIDFREVDSPDPPCMEKYYINHKMTEGFCGVLYRKSNAVLLFEYDETKLPYVGFWKTLGGYRGDFNCALEPSNGFFDSIERAQKNGACPELAPGEEFMFSIRMRVRQHEDTL
ncbi:MAG: DUF4432 family protein [Sphaerochaeta sp.]|nr:DUF4432 family protein [Sphaerochaeta sp.]